MKIGAFSKSIGLSVMTIRYYMSEGLLLPEKNGSQWEFTAREARDMAMIQDMRACGFSVQNIKRLLTLYRGSSPDLIAERKIIGEEYQKLLEERKATEQAITLLKGAIEEICPPPEESAPCCIPFSLFKLIACPYCRGVLHWNSVVIHNNAIRQGHGSCGCGFAADIDEGILIANNRENIIIPIVDSDRQTIKKRRPQDVSCIEKYYVWLLEHLREQNLDGKVIFEDVINTICFCSRAVEELPGRPSFILCDTDTSVVKYYAKNMRLLRPDCRLLMIVDDGVHHPLVPGCIDVVLDYCCSEIHQSYGYLSLCSTLAPYVKDGAYMLGRFTYMTKRRKPLEETKPGYTRADEKRYSLEVLQQDMREHNVDILSEIKGEERLDESIYDGCAPGDEIRPYVFTARWNRTR